MNTSEKRVMNNGYQRDTNHHKPQTTAMDGYVRKRFGYHMRLGALNYGEDNFRDADTDDKTLFATLESADRHWCHILDDFRYNNGEMSEDHISAMMFGLILLMGHQRKLGMKETHYFEQLFDKAYQNYLNRENNGEQ